MRISGTAGRVAKARGEKEAERLAQIELVKNQTALMRAVSDFLTTHYGADAFFMNHPLVAAIRHSIAGQIVDLQELSNAVTSYQIPVPVEPIEGGEV